MRRSPLFIIVIAISGCAAPAASHVGASSPARVSPVAESVSASASAAPLAEPTPTSVPEPLETIGDGFTEVADLTSGQDRPAFVTAWGEGFVALGSGQVVWTSPNGLDWAMAPSTGLDGWVAEVVELGDGSLLAIGYAHTSPPAGVFRSWTSADGVRWDAVDLGFDDGFIFLDLARGPRGYVMVGRQPSAGPGPSAEQLWHSSDGRAWVLARSTTDDEIIHAVGAGPDGFVAVGQQGWLEDRLRAIVVASADGLEWIEAPADEGLLREARGLWTIAPIGGDWVTAPYTVGAHVDILRSGNGLDWELRASFAVEPQDVGVLAALFGDGRRIFADVPFSQAPALDPESVWSSADAIMWADTGVPKSTAGLRFATSGGVTVFLVDGRVFATDA